MKNDMTDKNEEYKDQINKYVQDNTRGDTSRLTNSPNLDDLLRKISGTPFENDDIDSFVEMLNKFYQNDRRHSYAEIFVFLSELQGQCKKENKEINSVLEVVDNNIRLISDYIKQQNVVSEGVQEKYEKLQDHVLLETARIKFWHNNQTELKESVDILRQELAKERENAKDLKKKSQAVMDDVNTFRTTQVTVLSVFIAILLILVTDLKFTSSVMEIANKILFHKTLLLISFGGFVALNLSFGILLFVAKLINRDLAVKCKECTELANGTSQCSKNCCFVSKLYKRYPYIFLMDVLLALVIVVLLVYHYRMYLS